MNTIKNTGFLNIFAVNTLNGFIPSVGYVYNAGAATVAITDNSTYGAGDAIKILHFTLTDCQGTQVKGNVTVAGGGGAVTVSTATLDLTEGFNITASLVTNLSAFADMGTYNVGGLAPASGNLGSINKQIG